MFDTGPIVQEIYGFKNMSSEEEKQVSLRKYNVLLLLSTTIKKKCLHLLKYWSYNINLNIRNSIIKIIYQIIIFSFIIFCYLQWLPFKKIQNLKSCR